MRSEDEFYYGFEPPEPDPTGCCEWCGEPIYNEDHIIDGDILCPDCEETYYSDEAIVDFARTYFGSMPEIINDMINEKWFPEFGKTIRAWYGDMLKAMIKKDDAVLHNDAAE